jgi:hypothetical protein
MKSAHGVACGVLVSAVLAVAIGALAQSVQQLPDDQRVIGTWELIGYDSNDAESQQLRGPKPTGLIYYDDTGHMAVQILPDRVRPRFSGPVSGIFTGPRPTPAEALDAITGYAAYFGTYRVDERAKTVTHKRIGNVNPGALGDFVRRYEFQGDDVLELTPLERRDVRAVRLSWKRLKRTSPGDPSRR